MKRGFHKDFSYTFYNLLQSVLLAPLWDQILSANITKRYRNKKTKLKIVKPTCNSLHLLNFLVVLRRKIKLTRVVLFFVRETNTSKLRKAGTSIYMRSNYKSLDYYHEKDLQNMA